jgi:mannose-6-phosphate isomerase-like protein (cupin superfamily)
MKRKMIIKHITDIKEIIAGDRCFLREIFHPDRDAVKSSHSIAFAYIQARGRTRDHYLDKQSETYYILKGRGIMTVDEKKFPVEAGHSYYIPEKSHQWLENASEEKLEFLVIVDPPWQAEDEYLCGT